MESEKYSDKFGWRMWITAILVGIAILSFDGHYVYLGTGLTALAIIMLGDAIHFLVIYAVLLAKEQRCPEEQEVA